jgi:hypothetical protein
MWNNGRLFIAKNHDYGEHIMSFENTKTGVIVLGVVSSIIAAYIWEGYLRDDSAIAIKGRLTNADSQSTTGGVPDIPPAQPPPVDPEKKGPNVAPPVDPTLPPNGQSSAAEGLYREGAELYAKGDYDNAIQRLNGAIGLKSDFAEAFCLRGRARYASHDFASAVRDCDEAIRLKPDFSDAFYQRGAARVAVGDVAGSQQDYNRALQLKKSQTPKVSVPMLHSYRGGDAIRGTLTISAEGVSWAQHDGRDTFENRQCSLLRLDPKEDKARNKYEFDLHLEGRKRFLLIASSENDLKAAVDSYRALCSPFASGLLVPSLAQ